MVYSSIEQNNLRGVFMSKDKKQASHNRFEKLSGLTEMPVVEKPNEPPPCLK
jgi:hypothetical protein